jgi:hypothetical protein
MQRVAIILTVTALSCLPAPAQQRPKDMTFPSGRKVTFLSVQEMEVKHDDGGLGTALLLEYQTKLKIMDVVRLNKEIDEIWTWLKVDVVHRKLTEAVIRVVDSPDSATDRTFSFTKLPDGSWRRQNPGVN